MSLFSAADYQTLAQIVFALEADGRPRYPGYRPEVVELPNGDGRADRAKRYAHIATKYLTQAGPADAVRLNPYLLRAHAEAERVARALGVPEAFMPDIRFSALRVLEYPPGATSARHTDFDLFTLLCYRDRPEWLVRHRTPGEIPLHLDALDCVSPGLHLGELGEIVGLGPATPHEVVPVYDAPWKSAPTWPAPRMRQHSIVYFALPSHDARFPGPQDSSVWTNLPYGALAGQTVGQWLSERMARSRAPA